MQLIPAGEFLMGSPSSEPERQESEGPQHRVRIEKPFAIGKYAVTFEEYDAFVKATQRDKFDDEDWGRGRRPTINVSWEDAAAYTMWLCEQTGKHYRQPSEAEWEYAARAGTTTPFHTGEQITTAQANFNGNHTYNGSAQGENRGKTVAVGSFPANTFGLHDVHGNVWEWCMIVGMKIRRVRPRMASHGNRETVPGVRCAAARGSTGRGGCVPPTATRSSWRTAASAGDSGSPGHFNFFLLSFSLYFGARKRNPIEIFAVYQDALTRAVQDC